MRKRKVKNKDHDIISLVVVDIIKRHRRIPRHFIRLWCVMAAGLCCGLCFMPPPLTLYQHSSIQLNNKERRRIRLTRVLHSNLISFFSRHFKCSNRHDHPFSPGLLHRWLLSSSFNWRTDRRTDQQSNRVHRIPRLESFRWNLSAPHRKCLLNNSSLSPFWFLKLLLAYQTNDDDIGHAAG